MSLVSMKMQNYARGVNDETKSGTGVNDEAEIWQ
jgi:hypothetical protein